MVNGSAGTGTLTVGSGATLTGAGTASFVVVNSGGAVSGNLTASSGSLLSPGSSFNVTITNASTFTQLLGGPVSLGGVTLNVTLAGGFTPSPSNTFAIIPGTVTGTFSGLPNGATFTAGGVTFRIAYGSVSLTPLSGASVTALSSWGLALLAILLVALGAMAARSPRRVA